MYLTHGQYTAMGYDALDGFDKWLAKASVQLDNLTNDFYVQPLGHDLEADKSSEHPWEQARAQAFVKALAATINHMQAHNVGSSADVTSDQYTTVQMGRMTLSKASAKDSNASVLPVPIEVTTSLARYGMCYGGVASV